MKTIIVAYVLVNAMSSAVMNYIEKGYQPYGNPACTNLLCYQAMVKTKEVPEESKE